MLGRATSSWLVVALYLFSSALIAGAALIAGLHLLALGTMLVGTGQLAVLPLLLRGRSRGTLRVAWYSCALVAVACAGLWAVTLKALIGNVA